MGIHAIDEANRAISEAADPDANIIIGLIEDPTMGNTVQITVIATDFEDATTEYTSNIERRVVGGVLPETPDNTNNTSQAVGLNMTSKHQSPIVEQHSRQLDDGRISSSSVS